MLIADDGYVMRVVPRGRAGQLVRVPRLTCVHHYPGPCLTCPVRAIGSAERERARRGLRLPAFGLGGPGSYDFELRAAGRHSRPNHTCVRSMPLGLAPSDGPSCPCGKPCPWKESNLLDSRSGGSVPLPGIADHGLGAPGRREHHPRRCSPVAGFWSADSRFRARGDPVPGPVCRSDLPAHGCRNLAIPHDRLGGA